MVKEPSHSLASVLFGKTRGRLMGLMFTRPDESFYLNEIARRTGAGLGPVQRELKQLEGAGILSRTQRGRSAFYQANPACPIYSELKSIVIKTVGAADIIRNAIERSPFRVSLAFIFGSFAKSSHSASSDVDLLVISPKLSFSRLVVELREPQRKLGREINPVLYTPGEFSRKLRLGHHFIQSVVAQEKLFLIGDASELARLGKKRVAQAAHARSV